MPKNKQRYALVYNSRTTFLLQSPCHSILVKFFYKELGLCENPCASKLVTTTRCTTSISYSKNSKFYQVSLLMNLFDSIYTLIMLISNQSKSLAVQKCQKVCNGPNYCKCFFLIRRRIIFHIVIIPHSISNNIFLSFILFLSQDCSQVYCIYM